jgi:nucleoside-diphosphate-sugar epimerase
MRILLTGPTGFIGGSLLRRLLAAGHHVAALVHPDQALPDAIRAHPSVQCLVGSLATAPWPAIHEFGPTACVHTAWITTPGQYWESPENDRFVEWSLTFAAEFFRGGGTHFVGLGTCAEYAPARVALDEIHSPTQSTTRYARAKNALRLELESLAQQQQTRVAWARLFYPYGVGELHARFCSALLHQLSRGEVVELKTPRSIKDYIYIDDVADALHALLLHRYQGIINVGTGVGTTVRQMAIALATTLDRCDLVRESTVPAVDPLEHVVADASRLRGLGWEPKTSLAEGTRRLAQQLVPNHVPPRTLNIAPKKPH